jgi:hypothetical protein
MSPFTKSATKSTEDYSRVPSSDDGDDRTIPDHETFQRIDSRKRNRPQKFFSLRNLCLIISILLLGVLIIVYYVDTRKPHTHQKPTAQSQAVKPCQDPAIRREWRSLSKAEKNNYVDAVQCLANKPSRLRSNGTLYDDFPWVHRKISHISKETPGLFISLTDNVQLTVLRPFFHGTDTSSTCMRRH